MKKVTKAAVATGAAVLLLIGSGSTLAYWNSTTPLSGQNGITAGNLQLTAGEKATWSIEHMSGEVKNGIDINTVRIVPGDKLTYSYPATITASGDNLRIKVSVANGAITAANEEDQNDQLADQLKRTATFEVKGATPLAGTTAPSDASETFIFDHKKASSGTYETTVSATITWPFGTEATKENDAMLGKVNLANFDLTVTQLDGTKAP